MILELDAACNDRCAGKEEDGGRAYFCGIVISTWSHKPFRLALCRTALDVLSFSSLYFLGEGRGWELETG